MSQDTITPDEYRKAQRGSKLELAFETQLKQLFMHRGWDIDAIQREHQFCEDRQWRADFAVALFEGGEVHAESMGVLLIEIEGGTRQYGRHNRHDGMTGDCYKYSAASALGYTILRGTSQMVTDGTLLRMVEETLTGDLNIEDWKSP